MNSLFSSFEIRGAEILFGEKFFSSWLMNNKASTKNKVMTSSDEDHKSLPMKKQNEMRLGLEFDGLNFGETFVTSTTDNQDKKPLSPKETRTTHTKTMNKK
ncbi:hypothetical protein CsatB_004187 [Cannabis sativa]